jgi:hypothetical protein
LQRFHSHVKEFILICRGVAIAAKLPSTERRDNLEGALWRSMSRETARRGGKVTERLRHSQAVVREVIAATAEYAATDLDAVVEEDAANVRSAGPHALVRAAAHLHIFHEEFRQSHPFGPDSVLPERQQFGRRLASPFRLPPKPQEKLPKVRLVRRRCLTTQFRKPQRNA